MNFDPLTTIHRKSSHTVGATQAINLAIDSTVNPVTDRHKNANQLYHHSLWSIGHLSDIGQSLRQWVKLSRTEAGFSDRYFESWICLPEFFERPSESGLINHARKGHFIIFIYLLFIFTWFETVFVDFGFTAIGFGMVFWHIGGWPWLLWLIKMTS